MKNVKATIIKNEKINAGFYKMRVASPYLAKASKPGQFIEVRCADALDPLLRRPFGVHRIYPDGIEMLYEVVGKGTTILSKKQKGDTVEILGPLGNGFTINQLTNKPTNQQTILIAGGIGIAPLLALAEELADSVERVADRKKVADSVERIADREKIVAIIGARSKTHVNCENEFKKLGCKVVVTTDDGSKGKKGLVTDILSTILRSTKYEVRRTICACGPNPMLKAIWTIAKEHNISCQFSFESHMACGIGVCLGCPIKVYSNTHDATRTTQHEYKMICKDGPVFNGEDIVW